MNKLQLLHGIGIRPMISDMFQGDPHQRVVPTFLSPEAIQTIVDVAVMAGIPLQREERSAVLVQPLLAVQNNGARYPAYSGPDHSTPASASADEREEYGFVPDIATSPSRDLSYPISIFPVKHPFCLI